MKKNVSRSSRELVVRIAVPVLFAALCVLTALTIFTISWSSTGAGGGFDLAGLTNEARRDNSDVSGYLLPEFIGITVDGTRRGISVSANVVAELYDILTPTLRSAFSSAEPQSDTMWEEYTAARNSVYIKYHSELPDGILALFAGMAQEGRETSVTFDGNVREMFVLPPSSVSAETLLVTRSDLGDVKKYVIPSRKAAVSADELERFVRFYGSGMSEFHFNEGRYPNLAWTEPVYTEALQTRKLLMTDRTAVLIQNSAEEKEAVLRLFGLNPDKLLNVHEEEDGSSSYYDTHGILYFRASSIEYLRSSADSGVSVSEILGTAFSGDNPSEMLKAYIRTAVLLYEKVAAVNPVYSGGEADLLLRSVTSENGEVTLRFMYAVGNVPISDEQDAYRITFADGRIRHAVLHTVAVRVLADRETSYTEWWFASKLGRFSSDVRLVYRSDYLSESVAAEWAAEELIFPAADTDRNMDPEEEDEYGK